MNLNIDKIKNGFKNFLSNDNEDPNKAKEAQKKKILLIVGVILGVMAFTSILSSDSTPKRKKTNVNNTSVLVDADKDNIARNKWLKIANDQLDNNSERLKNQELEITNLKNELKQLKENLVNTSDASPKSNIQNEHKSNASTSPTSTPLPQPNNLSDVEKLSNSLKDEFNKLKEDTQKKLQAKSKQLEEDDEPERYEQPPVNYPPMPKQVPTMPQMQEIIIDEPLTDTLSYQKITQEEAVQKEVKEVKKKDILQIAATSVLRGTLLSGVDAPTMAKGKSNPLPILIQLTDFSLGANHHRQDLRDCFVIAEAIGDLASERAYIRTNTMHCVNSTNDSIIFNLKGYVSGEDGKNGLRGRIVTKAGALIGRTILANTISGIGTAFGNLGQTTIVSGAGTQSVNNAAINDANRNLPNSQEIRSALGSGIAAASNKLADFYLKMADEVSPIIEISAGRKVEIIVTETAEVDFDNTKQYNSTIERSGDDSDE